MKEKEAQFLQLIEQHQGILHKICRLYRNTAAEREDLLQDMMYQLWKSFPSFRGEARFSSWMYRVALSTAIAKYKKPGIATTHELKHEPAALSDESSERQEALRSAMERLNPIEKAVMSLYLEDYKYEEMAEILGISVSLVGVKLNRIRKKLKEWMKA
ncbi:MAG: sigma-70 family RNA polymerase sigma factor [Bacteroidota bacterium]